MKRLLVGCVLALVAVFAPAVLLSVTGCGGADSSSPPTTVSRTEVRADNGLIAFVHGDGGLGDISVVSPDGSGRAALVNGGADELYPAWSPDGTKLAYTTDETGSSVFSHGDIVIVDADGSNSVNVTDRSDAVPETDDWDPSWAPDGRQLAYMGTVAPDTFESENEELPDLYVVNIDGSDRRNITSTPDVFEVAPEWSPGGSEIAFISGDNTGQSLHLSVINVDGSNPRELTDVRWGPMRGTNGFLLWIYGLSWSPDGSQIAFSDSVSDDGDTWNVHVFVINADGTGRRDLTAGQPRSSLDPEWSPDGRQIAFVTDRDDDEALYIMDADGSNPQRITGSNSRLGFPDWQPIPR